MAERKPLVAANWKMHKTVAETGEFLDRFVAEAGGLDGVDLVVCPPYTALAAAVERARGSTVTIAAQNMHWEPTGAFTGEIAAPMLVELGVGAVILGHSERREYFAETDEALARKVPAALESGLIPILCVGESESQRDDGETESVLDHQLAADLAVVPTDRLSEVAIAYEPIWAIGTGRTATPQQAQEAIAFIRGQLPHAASDAVRIVYGGSVKPGNAAELFAEADIDGGLVGGASLEPEDFLEICRAAAS